MKHLAIKFLIIVLLITQLPLFGQNSSFVFQGKVGDLNAPAIAYLRYAQSGKSVTDSVELKKGRFEFKGSVRDPMRASVILYHKGKGPVRERGDYLSFYLEPGTIKVESKDSLKYGIITGSKINEANKKLTEALKPFEEKRAVVQQIYRNATEEDRKTESFRESATKQYNEMLKLQKSILTRFITENTGSWLSLDALNTIGGSKPEVSEVEPIFNSLSDEVKNTATGKKYAMLLANLKLLANGLPAPDFTQNDQDGKPVKLSGFRGKYVLIDFWASWCGAGRKIQMLLKHIISIKIKILPYLAFHLTVKMAGKPG
jgi:hypothetical protein